MEQAFVPGPDGTPVPQGAHPTPGMMEAQMVKQTVLKEQEDREMAEAAYVTIKNLNERIDDKNDQLSRKEKMMEEIRE